jgi:LysM repeat protein
MKYTAFTSRTRRVVSTLAAIVVATALASCSTSHSASRATASTLTPPAPVLTEPITTTTTLPVTRYRVQRGDTMIGIARRFRVSVAAIVARNHLANPDRVAAGQMLLIPPPPPLSLVVTPPTGPAGQAFALHLVGAEPSETITFEVRAPRGTYRGPRHTATSDGSVTTTYQTAQSDDAGTYTVTAHGQAGTTISAMFRVVPPGPPIT